MAFSKNTAYFAFYRAGSLYKVRGDQLKDVLTNSDLIFVGQGSNTVKATVLDIRNESTTINFNTDIVAYTDISTKETYKLPIKQFKDLVADTPPVPDPDVPLTDMNLRIDSVSHMDGILRDMSNRPIRTGKPIFVVAQPYSSFVLAYSTNGQEYVGANRTSSGVMGRLVINRNDGGNTPFYHSWANDRDDTYQALSLDFSADIWTMALVNTSTTVGDSSGQMYISYDGKTFRKNSGGFTSGEFGGDTYMRRIVFLGDGYIAVDKDNSGYMGISGGIGPDIKAVANRLLTTTTDSRRRQAIGSPFCAVGEYGGEYVVVSKIDEPGVMLLNKYGQTHDITPREWEGEFVRSQQLGKSYFGVVDGRGQMFVGKLKEPLRGINTAWGEMKTPDVTDVRTASMGYTPDGDHFIMVAEQDGQILYSAARGRKYQTVDPAVNGSHPPGDAAIDFEYLSTSFRAYEAANKTTDGDIKIWSLQRCGNNNEILSPEKQLPGMYTKSMRDAGYPDPGG